jgi:hypothetical protein
VYVSLALQLVKLFANILWCLKVIYEFPRSLKFMVLQSNWSFANILSGFLLMNLGPLLVYL